MRPALGIRAGLQVEDALPNAQGSADYPIQGTAAQQLLDAARRSAGINRHSRVCAKGSHARGLVGSNMVDRLGADRKFDEIHSHATRY